MDKLIYSIHPLSTNLVGTIVGDVDDWSGVTDSRQRRKIQNRRNQRARRAKKRDNKDLSANAQLVLKRSDPIWLPDHTSQLLEMHGAEATKTIIRAINLVNIHYPKSDCNLLVMQRFEEIASHSYAIRLLELSLLPSLSQYNFVRALLANIDILGFAEEDMGDGAVSPFNRATGLAPISYTKDELSQLPAGLQPTELQCKFRHHPCIDLIPVPTMRDNIFRRKISSYSFNPQELCYSMRGLTPNHNTGVLVWGDPWDPTGWEVTEEFARSWSWAIEGCWDLLRSTNSWRARRGEKPLFRLPS